MDTNLGAQWYNLQYISIIFFQIHLSRKWYEIENNLKSQNLRKNYQNKLKKHKFRLISETVRDRVNRTEIWDNLQCQ